MILLKITNHEHVQPCENCSHIINKYKTNKIYCYTCNDIDL